MCHPPLGKLHSDHSRSIIKMQEYYAFQVYAPGEVCDKYPKCHRLDNLKRYTIGGFIVMPLRVPHGDCECFAYHITMPDGQTLLFCTDAQTLPYRLPNVNTLMIEANFSEGLIIDRLCEGQDIRSHFNTHMGLNETIKVIKRLNNPNLNKVILIHLSNGNSDIKMFKNRIFSETGIRCEIANQGMTVELKEDF